MSRALPIAFQISLLVCGVSLAGELTHTTGSDRDDLKKASSRVVLYDPILRQSLLTDVGSLIRIHSTADLQRKRKALIRVTFGTESIPVDLLPGKIHLEITDPNWPIAGSLERIDSLRHTMEHGIDSLMYYFHARQPASRLAIYHEGHVGGFKYGTRAIHSLLGMGFDVIALAMPLKGRNSRPMADIEHIGPIHLSRHNQMGDLDRPLRFFMEPIAAAVNHGLARRDYRDLVMMGFSGGGWATTVYAAMDPRISRSYSIAGTLPYALRSPDSPARDPDERSLGDLEQRFLPLLRAVNYLEMYVMGAAGKDRRQLQIFLQHETTGLLGVDHRTYEEVVRERIRELGAGGFDVALDTTSRKHWLTPTALDLTLKDLEAPTEPPIAPGS